VTDSRRYLVPRERFRARKFWRIRSALWLEPNALLGPRIGEREATLVRLEGRWMAYWRASRLLYCARNHNGNRPRHDARWRKRQALERAIHAGAWLPF
jgi:hypothetical protein